MLKNGRTPRIVLYALVLALVIGGVLYYFRADIQTLVEVMKSDRTPPLLVILSFLVLPVAFFPITALLVLIGIRFDVWWGILIMLLSMPFHLLFSFWVTHFLLRKRMERFARNKGEAILNIPEHRHVEFGLLFMAVPGLPYAVKNYLLPLSGIGLGKYLLISWIVQGGMGIPFVILGDAAAQYSTSLFILFALLFVVAYIITQSVRRLYNARFGGGRR